MVSLELSIRWTPRKCDTIVEANGKNDKSLQEILFLPEKKFGDNWNYFKKK